MNLEMTTMDLLKAIDALAQQVNSCWNLCEALKVRIAEDAGISRKKMEAEGIRVISRQEKENET